MQTTIPMFESWQRTAHTQLDAGTLYVQQAQHDGRWYVESWDGREAQLIGEAGFATPAAGVRAALEAAAAADPDAPGSEPALVAAAVKATGLPARRFATRVLARDERTVRRWLSGEQAVPDVVVARLYWLLALDADTRAALVAILDT